jgi:uncharacterized phage protein (TIGR02218 family)
MAELETNFQETQQSPTPEFYVFSSPDGNIERYTSYSRSLTFLGQVFTAASITRGGIRHDTKFGEIKLNITTPITPNIAKYIPNTPIQPVDVIIYRSHIDYLTQYEIFFKGSIKHVQFGEKLASAVAVSSNKFLGIKLPTIIYQAFCNHDIYDDGCGVDRSYEVAGVTQYKRTATISALPDNGKNIQFTLVTGAAISQGDLAGGEVITSYADRRLITAHDSQYEIGVHVPFDARVSVGDSITLYPGCDGSPATCKNVFNNLYGPGGTAVAPIQGKGFLGMPYIPSKNPAIWGFK